MSTQILTISSTHLLPSSLTLGVHSPGLGDSTLYFSLGNPPPTPLSITDRTDSRHNGKEGMASPSNASDPVSLRVVSWEVLRVSGRPPSEGQIFSVAGAVRDVGLSEASFLGVSHLLAAYVFATLWLWCFMGGASHWVAELSAGSLIYWFKCSILYLEQMTQ